MITLKFMTLFKEMEEDIEEALPQRIEKDAIKHIKTIRQLDEAVTAKLYDFPDVDSYYRDHSCISTMPAIAVPLLCLNAADDPLMDPMVARCGDQFADTNPNIVSVVTSHGGHLGWVTGYRKQWMSSAVADFLLALHALAASDLPRTIPHAAEGSASASEGLAASDIDLAVPLSP